MHVFPLLVFLFLAVPLLEIYLFIQVGGWIGVWPTIGLVVLTAIVGTFLLRWQGLVTLARVRRSVDAGQIPAREMLEGVFLVFGGALLLTPGFFTDAVGLACLLPAARGLMADWLVSRGILRVRTPRGGPPPGGGRTIEGEYTKDADGRTRDE